MTNKPLVDLTVAQAKAIELARKGQFINSITGEVFHYRHQFMVPVDLEGVDCQAAAARERELLAKNPLYKCQENLTEQSHEADCNVNTVVARFQKTGDLSLIQKSKGMFMDLSLMPQSYQECLDYVSSVDDLFQALPATVRREYDNSPSNFMRAAVNDPDKVYRHAEQVLSPVVPKVVPEAPSAAPVAPKEAPESKPEKK
ncbi:MAG: internal scaffolding protein [Microviridae sp.]|nr:MAG: internal scaffolding protein [Microviridae sp.]